MRFIDLFRKQAPPANIRCGWCPNSVIQIRTLPVAEWGQREMTDAELAVLFPEPPRVEGKHRFMGGTCVDCGHPLDDVCTANLDLDGYVSGLREIA